MTDFQRALRCHECADGANHYDHDLRDRVAEAIRGAPNTEAPWWIGPESVLGAIEEFLNQRDEDCTCGWGGAHDEDNPRCALNRRPLMDAATTEAQEEYDSNPELRDLLRRTAQAPTVRRTHQRPPELKGES